MTPYRTKDLNLAAFLWSQPGTKLVKTDGDRQTGGRTIFFSFELDVTDEQLLQLQLDYANGDTRVEPQAFCAKQSQLRDVLHSSLGTTKRKNSK